MRSSTTERPFSQPFPLLELRFADLNSNLIASRRFKPGEYLNGDLEGKVEMPPQTPMPHRPGYILNPGTKAVNCSLSFRLRPSETIHCLAIDDAL